MTNSDIISKAPNITSSVEKKKESKITCIGPVNELEEYVKKDWWKKIFNSFYLKTDADVVDDQKITQAEVDFFSKILELNTEQHILDLCCGQGRHSIELASRGFNKVEGLDRSRYLIQKARSSAKKQGVFLKFKEGDARKLQYHNDEFDRVLILGNSFGYFETINDDLKVLKEVYRILKPWGKLLIDLTDGAFVKQNFQPRSWEWIDKEYFVCRERALSTDEQRLISREVITHVNKGVLVDQFYAERLYSEDQIKNLLTRAGFSDIQFHGTINPNSQRNQDLGMMEQRIIVTTTVKKDWSEQRIKPKNIKKKCSSDFW
ncbi:MAG: class I SAM-dependent methyltransferase [Candidatus Hermodarchaeota archaeon]